MFAYRKRRPGQLRDVSWLAPIRVMARVLRVSASGYYAWRSRMRSAHAQADAVLLCRIRTIHLASRSTYGAPRVHAEHRAQPEAGARRAAWPGRGGVSLSNDDVGALSVLA